MITIRLPSLVYTSGEGKGLPLFAPVVVSSSNGALTNGPLSTLPPLARNSSISLSLNARIAFSLNSAIVVSFKDEGEDPCAAHISRARCKNLLLLNLGPLVVPWARLFVGVRGLQYQILAVTLRDDLQAAWQ